MKRRYWVILILVFLVGLDWYIRAPDARSRHLTSAIQDKGSPALKHYPYKFHVLRVQGDVAVVGTPRSFAVPASQMLAVLYPELDTHNRNDPAFIAAEKELAGIQAEAQRIVLAQPGIKSVQWELDRDWLTGHGIEMPER